MSYILNTFNEILQLLTIGACFEPYHAGEPNFPPGALLRDYHTSNESYWAKLDGGYNGTLWELPGECKAEDVL